jgi:PRTRC genetic system protein A
MRMNWRHLLRFDAHDLHSRTVTSSTTSANVESTAPSVQSRSGHVMGNKITGHLIAREAVLPPIQATMREYVFAGNGVFVRARRPGLEVVIPTQFPIPLLPRIEPYVRLDYPRVPAGMVEAILARALEAMDEQQQLIEMLFYLSWNDAEGWQLEIPAQVQKRAQVAPLNHGPNSPYTRALIEVHSHHEWPAFFSKEWDDRDEQGFRVYVVIGNILERPELRTRVGLYGEVFEIPSVWIFEMPSRIHDCVAEEWAVQPSLAAPSRAKDMR